MYAVSPLSSSVSSSSPPQHPQAALYARVGVETGVGSASPHQLVGMLFDGYAVAVATAKSALAAGDVQAKCAAINRAVRIVDEGLKASLDPAGGALARDLNELYAYVVMRLTQANLGNDPARLDECLAVMQPLREAWAAIGPSVAARRN